MAEYICKNGILRPINHIYQCVDKLIEGVDYERYDWLKSTGKEAIKTIFIPDYKSITLYLKVRDFVRQSLASYVCAAGAVTGDGYGFSFSVRGGTTDAYRITDGYNSITNIAGPTAGVHTLELKNGEAWGDGVKKTTSYTSVPVNNSRYLGIFGNHTGATNCTEGYIARLTITSEYGNIDLVPCKLLRDISASLSSDNKPQPKDRCGMFDTISGKFFGDARGVHKFSVYND